MSELLEADEVFGTGTAVVVAPVGTITYRGKRCVKISIFTREANDFKSDYFYGALNFRARLC